MALEREIQTYDRELPNLLQQEGKFALVHGDAVDGVYDTYAEALKAGYAKHQLEPFLVKCIEAVERVQFFTRPLAPCP